MNLLTMIKLVMLEGRVIVYSSTASKVTSFMITFMAFFPGALTFSHKGNGKLAEAQRAWKQLGLPLKIFNK